jgi:uncharacterized SAM-dependent methyltransferase
MNLISQRDQAVHIGGRRFIFEAGEKVVTEFSYKHTPDGFAELGRKAGFEFDELWTDEEKLFGVFFFRRPQ